MGVPDHTLSDASKGFSWGRDAENYLFTLLHRSAYCFNFKAAASTWMRIYAQLYKDSSFWEEVKDSQLYYK